MSWDTVPFDSCTCRRQFSRRFTFDLADFNTGNTPGNLFMAYEDATENGGVENFGLNKEITATYHNPDGSTKQVTGLLIWVR
jgi:hypothetical protein